jgi:hypothetical protein
MRFIRRSPTALSLAVALLAGCANQVMNSVTDHLIGQPVSVVIDRLGVPTEERTIAGMKVYIWTTGTIWKGTEYKCTIRAIMSGDVIRSFDWEGDEVRCSEYAQSLQSTAGCRINTLLRPCK